MLDIRAIFIGFAVALGAIVVIVLAILFSPYIGTRVAPGLSFKILGPSVLKTGERMTITWDVSTQGSRAYPYEKIEFCPGKTSIGCVQLSAVAPNTGKAVVEIPQLKSKTGYIRLTARDASKKLLWMLSSRSPVKVVPGKTVIAVQQPSDNSGGGGGGGGSNDGGGSDPTPNPTATLTVTPAPSTAATPSIVFTAPAPGSSVLTGSSVQVQATMTYSSTDPITCQTWLLDGKPIANTAWNNGVPPC
ncbi:MAG: hypothetical protein K8Q97_01565 [Candidatus Andersenbacteria bacterium]|nr:hypothetical protein [Candidatus Andersenbacteria bacterium]